MKLIRTLEATALFVIVLVVCYYVHIHFFKVNVVLYAAVADGVIATLICGVLLFALPYFSILGHFEKFLLLVVWIISGYACAISVPALLDRSLSFYILEKLQQRGGGIRQDSFPQVFTQEYLKEHRLVDVRLTEQLESGTVVIHNGCVILTKRGEQLASFGRYFRTHLLPKQRLLMGRYSDDLTDPFRHSSQDPGYTCHIP